MDSRSGIHDYVGVCDGGYWRGRGWRVFWEGLTTTETLCHLEHLPFHFLEVMGWGNEGIDESLVSFKAALVLDCFGRWYGPWFGRGFRELYGRLFVVWSLVRFIELGLDEFDFPGGFDNHFLFDGLLVLDGSRDMDLFGSVNPHRSARGEHLHQLSRALTGMVARDGILPTVRLLDARLLGDDVKSLTQGGVWSLFGPCVDAVVVSGNDLGLLDTVLHDGTFQPGQGVIQLKRREWKYLHQRYLWSWMTPYNRASRRCGCRLVGPSRRYCWAPSNSRYRRNWVSRAFGRK